MARLKIDPKTLAARERELRDELKRVRQQRRQAEDATRQARLARVGELADQFKITRIQDTVLAAEFKRIAAEHPVPAATESPANSADDTAEAGDVTQTPTNAAAHASPESAEGAVETAGGGGAHKRWGWK